MEIKPSWLLEGTSVHSNLYCAFVDKPKIVAPHFFKPADLEQFGTGDKKMPKAIGASSSAS